MFAKTKAVSRNPKGFRIVLVHAEDIKPSSDCETEHGKTNDCPPTFAHRNNSSGVVPLALSQCLALKSECTK
jgi:hypothetical protein